MGFTTRVFFTALFLISVFAITSMAQNTFKCTSGGTCNSLIDYVSPNTTTLSAITTLFGVENFLSILGPNNLPISTPRTYPVSAKQTIKIPFPCLCRNGTGISDRRPVYKVVPDDGLYHIAAEVFGGLVTFQQIQAVNNISDPNLIEVGQELWIPLPCSCDEVDGARVVHYGHVVAVGNTVEGIARQYNTTVETLFNLNGLNTTTANDIQAGVVLDVPLKACTSQVRNGSPDYPLLVPSGTYVFTATNCVRCRCDAESSWTLQCEPSGLNSSRWRSCPSSQCPGADSLYLGNTTSSPCNNRSICSYAGYTNNQTILTVLALDSTCPVETPTPNSGFHGWRWNFFLIVVLLCVPLFL